MKRKFGIVVDKTTMLTIYMSRDMKKAQHISANNEGLNKFAQLCSLIRIFTVHSHYAL